jgi:ABC-type lipoprotein export system ATPase subunit
MSEPPAIILRNVRKSFPVTDGASLEVLDVEHLALQRATCTILRGRNGSGKTTLLNLVAGITLPSAGTIHVNGEGVFALSEARRDHFRANHVGYVFQSFNLLAAFTALENVMLAMTFAGVVPKHLHRQRATELLARLGLAARLAHRPQYLSRGEQQRVAIARALANNPPIVLADEPCASLDPRTADLVLATFLTISRQDGKTLLMVSHEESVWNEADQVLDMDELNRAQRGMVAA